MPLPSLPSLFRSKRTIISRDLCDLCRSIDFTKADCGIGRGGYKHYSNYTQLLISAGNGCKLCKLVSEDPVGDVAQLSRETFENKQIYCNTELVYLTNKDDFRGTKKLIFCRDNVPFSTLYMFTPAGNCPKRLRAYLQTDQKADVKAATDNPAATSRIICGRPISPRGDSEACFSLAIDWIAECLTKHKNSCPHKKATLPTRVIDVGPRDGSSQPFLYIPQRHDPQSAGLWVSLSHCWGTAVKYTTTVNNLQNRTHTTSLQDPLLPRTFCDAIIVTRNLGFRYLWIDSLCILQDSRADWLSESTRMAEYYKNSIVTIAADDSTGDQDGFLHPRVPMSPAPVRIPVIIPGKISGYADLSLQDFSYPDRDEHASSPLNRRAWTLQEDVLPPRTLHYASHQISWECQYHQRMESDASVFKQDVQMTSQKRHFLHPESSENTYTYTPENAWYRILDNYLARKMTDEKDKLPAISGLAREIAVQTGWRYYAGLWDGDMLQGLLWNVHGMGKLLETYRAPSWSWASLDIIESTRPSKRGSIEQIPPCHVCPSPGVGFTAEIVECHVKPVEGDIYGRIESGYLKIRSQWLANSSLHRKTAPYFNHPNAFLQRISTYQMEDYWRKSHHLYNWHWNRGQPKDTDQLVYDLDQMPEEYVGGEVVPRNFPRDVSFLEIGRRELRIQNEETGSSHVIEGMYVVHALVLEPAEFVGKFRRRGLVEIPRVYREDLEGWVRRDVVIV
jgi:hypothetical protein